MGLAPRSWLWLPPVLACVADATVTLACQPPEYWGGRYDMALEGNPVARWIMEFHPLALIVCVVVEAAAIIGVVGWWRQSLAVPVATLLTLSHCCGIASWCVGVLGSGIAGWGLTVCVFLLAERLLHWTGPTPDLSVR
jgi:hypothetical protein